MVTRLVYGGGIADWSFGADDSNRALIVGGAILRFFDAEVGGNPITDLQNMAGSAITQVTTSGGADGRALGQIPPFYGPDSTFEMWASANDGPRVLMTAVNIGSFLGPVRDQLAAHLAPSNKNPHGTTISSLGETSGLADAATGSTIVKNSSGIWVAGAAATGGGGGGSGFDAAADQTVTGSWTHNTPAGKEAVSRVVLNAAATGQTADVLVAYSGTDTGQGGARQRTTYFNEKGELRVIAAKTNSVGVRFKGQPGQTADIMQITDTGNNPKAWVAANYAFYAPNAGFALTWVDEGDVAVSSGTFGWVNDLDVDVSVKSFRASLVTAYTSGDLILNPRVLTSTNVSTPLFTEATRPKIAAGSKTTGKLTAFSAATVPVGAMLIVDVAQIGAGNVGKGLFAQAMVM